MRSKSTGIKAKKCVTNTSNDQVHEILHNVLFKRPSRKKGATTFVFDKQQCLLNVMTQLERGCPEVLQSKEIFLKEMEQLFCQQSREDSGSN